MGGEGGGHKSFSGGEEERGIGRRRGKREGNSSSFRIQSGIFASKKKEDLLLLLDGGKKKKAAHRSNGFFCFCATSRVARSQSEVGPH